MKILSISTSTGHALCAIASNGAILCEKSSALKNTQADKIVTLVNEALKESNSLISEIKHVVVDIGPGSFTGLRVGISYVVGLSIALQASISPINTFDVLTYISKDLIYKYKKIMYVIQCNKHTSYVYTTNHKQCIINTHDIIQYANDIDCSCVFQESSSNLIDDCEPIYSFFQKIEGIDIFHYVLRARSIYEAACLEISNHMDNSTRKQFIPTIEPNYIQGFKI